MHDKRMHKIVVLRHGNQYSVIGIKHLTQKRIGLSGDNITKQALIDQRVVVHAVERYNLAIFRPI